MTKRYLKDCCQPIIRRLVTHLVHVKPEDPLDFMARWLAQERSVKLEEVEKDVIRWVKENDITKDERIYKREGYGDGYGEVSVKEDSEVESYEDGSFQSHGDQEGNYQLEVRRGSTRSPTKTRKSEHRSSDIFRIDKSNSLSRNPSGLHENKENNMYSSSESLGDHYSKNMRERIARRLNASLAFKTLSQTTKEILAEKMTERHVEKGETVIKQEDIGDCLYMVDCGELKCYKLYQGERTEIYLRDYLPGDTFGE